MTADPKAAALVTVHGGPELPSLEEAAAQLGVRVEDIDPSFGVASIDPTNGLYSVKVRSDRLPPDFAGRGSFRGPYSNPTIAPFGPPQAPGNSDDDND